MPTEYLYLVRFPHGARNQFVKGGEGFDLKIGDQIVCDTAKGIELGTVMKEAVKEYDFATTGLPIILRRALESDLKSAVENEKAAQEASRIFNQEAQNLHLPMQLVSAYYTLDREKLIFSYLASERVDFREFLKIMARLYRTRIDLRQINPRERAKQVGGVGVCGLTLCCANFFDDYEGVSLQKAKNQMLTINNAKINGQCGKLQCCIKYEDDVYTIEKKAFPNIGTEFEMEGKDYKIIGYNIITRNIKLYGPEGLEFVPLEKVTEAIKSGKTKNVSRKPNE